MATIKAFTDLEQSKKLAEILPLESADMTYYACVKDWRGNPVEPKWGKPTTLTKEELALPCSNHQEYEYLPCWSFASLLSVLPNSKHITTTLSRGGWRIEPVEYIDKWFCEYEEEVDEDSPYRGFTVSADNPVDACYEMIIRLNELNLL